MTAIVQGNKLHLNYLDGIRGAAASYVALFHASIIFMICTHDANDLHGMVRAIVLAVHFGLLNYGHFAVDIFIVLSGYCLMLPIARSGRAVLRGGVSEFLIRRAKRILPAYYVVLLGALVVMLFFSGLTSFAYYHSQIVEAPPTFREFLLYLVMLQNFLSKSTIDPPMWSVALECQIYVIFALVLLPAYRYGGALVLVVVAILLSALPHFLFGSWTDHLVPWFICLFALGMLAAKYTEDGRAATRTQIRAQMTGAAFCFGVIVVLSILQRHRWANVKAIHWLRQETWGSEFPMDIVVGIATLCLLIALGKAYQYSGKTFAGTLANQLGHPVLTRLGAISYSLYLIHAPILVASARLGYMLAPGGLFAGLTTVVVGLPVSVLAACWLSDNVEYIALRPKR